MSACIWLPGDWRRVHNSAANSTCSSHRPSCELSEFVDPSDGFGAEAVLQYGITFGSKAPRQEIVGRPYSQLWEDAPRRWLGPSASQCRGKLHQELALRLHIFCALRCFAATMSLALFGLLHIWPEYIIVFHLCVTHCKTQWGLQLLWSLAVIWQSPHSCGRAAFVDFKRACRLFSCACCCYSCHCHYMYMSTIILSVFSFLGDATLSRMPTW